MVVQEQAVVGQGAHAQANLGQVEQILQGQALAKVDAVGDILAQEQCTHQVVDIPSLTCDKKNVMYP